MFNLIYSTTLRWVIFLKNRHPSLCFFSVLLGTRILSLQCASLYPTFCLSRTPIDRQF